MTAAGNSQRQHDSVAPQPFQGDEADAAPPRPLLIALLAFAALYLAQCASPLRLDSDAVDYLITGAAIADGRALPDVPFPPGYPAVIAVLDRLGLGSTSFFIFANCVFLALGLWATWRIFNEHSTAVRMWIVVGTLLVISVVKSVATPLPEAAFFGTSLMSVAAASTAITSRGSTRWVLLSASMVVAALALSIRTVGVALIPMLLWAWWSALSDASESFRSRRKAIVITLALVFVGAAVVVVLSKTSTVADYLGHPLYWYVYGGLSSPVLGRIYSMLNGLGQMVVNLPFSRFHGLAPVFAAAGLVTLVLLVVGREKPARLRLVDVYLGFYLAVLAVWPYDSPRLWMPIAPLIAAHVVTALYRAREKPAMRLLVRLYAAWFAATGIAALAYTTRISFSGDNFSRVYGTDGGRATAALKTLGPKEIEGYNARVDTVFGRYGGSRTAR